MHAQLSLHPNETILIAAKPSLRVIGYWLLTVGFKAILALLFLLFLFHIAAPFPQRVWLQGLAVFILACTYFSWALLNRWCSDYVFTNLRCICATGILNQQRTMMTYDRLANLFLRRTWLERLLGLSSIVAEDFSGSRPFMMVGLDHHLAQTILDTISAKILKITS